MDQVLLGLKDIECLVYLDDILIFSSDMREHVRRISNVFDGIRDADYKLNLAKCTFLAPEVLCLGHQVSASGITPDETKVKAIRDFPTPGTLKEVRAFLWMVGFYRAFIHNFAAISRPLTMLTRKNVCFEWTVEQQEAFDIYKRRYPLIHCLHTLISNYHSYCDVYATNKTGSISDDWIY
jgi:hypothetical protein